MDLFYRIAYRVGFTPREAAASHPPAARHMTALLNRETRGHGMPPGTALDLGCGSGFWTVELPWRGWQATGIDSVPKALDRARIRARAVTTVARPGATLLILAWSPGSRGPLPRGLDRDEIARRLTTWSIIEEEPFDATGLPPPLRGVAPRIYRLHRH